VSNFNLIKVSNGVRYLEGAQGLSIPAHLADFYQTIGLLPNDLPTIDLSEAELAALKSKEGFSTARMLMKHLIDNTEPLNHADVARFLTEYEKYLLLFEFDLIQVESTLTSKADALQAEYSITRSPRVFKLFQSMGIPVMLRES
jgi:hypothetical protein